MQTNKHYEALPVENNVEGEARRVGFEFEFAGLTFAQAVDVVLDTFSGTVKSSTQAEYIIEVASLGEFVVEIDWLYLKKQAEHFKQQGKDDEWLKFVGDLATTIVPIEVVCPPIDWHDIHKLEDMIETLRRYGAKGTERSLFAAYGLHINTEAASLETDKLYAYIKAFAFLQDWLMQYHQVNFSRKVTPYIDLFQHDYIVCLCEKMPVSMNQLIDDYLKFNSTRNRALDMLPIFKHINADKVESAIQDDRIKARPAFHYRLPDCKINRQDWGVARAWNGWCMVEKLAHNETALDALTSQYMQENKTLTGVNRKTWLGVVQQCIENHKLA